jgi:predicted aspartyl protease
MGHRIFGENNGAKKVGRFSVEFEVANNRDVLLHEENSLPAAEIRSLRLSGLVDPGASSLVLPEKVANQLGLRVIGKVKVRYADGRRATRTQVKGAHVTIQGRSGDFKATLEKNRDTALIGAIVLEDLDFLVDCKKHRLVPRDPDYVVTEIEDLS